MAPVVEALRCLGIDAPILATAQHRHMLDQMLRLFNLQPKWDLDLMRPGQTPAQLTGLMVPALDALFREHNPDVVLAQGDTTTVFCTALACFYSRIPFGHVEAGLRSGDLASPFPEEGFRRLASVLTQFHFAPTEHAAQALLRENTQTSSIYMVGNTVIDALLEIASRPELPWPSNVPEPSPDERLVLVTLHRRESFGEPIERILQALRCFAQKHTATRFVYPVHPNPHVQEPAHRHLGDLANVHLTEPLDYTCLVAVLRKSYAVFTDSGGIQEEAPALGKPVLVFRDVTERQEAVDAGGVLLVGSDRNRFLGESERLWMDPEHYASMAKPRFPFGDGHAGERIARVLSNYFDHL